ncbi:MAG: MFS transporter [Dehalococcoidia bacterium]|nr:MFS transporter [Dehalococcoidia bacterium]
MIAWSKGIFYGWWIVVISFVVNALTTGVYWLGFSVLFLPISRDLGVSRAAASLPFTLRGVVGAFQSPLVGLLVDRIGPARVLFFGALAGGLGFLLLSRAEAYLVFMAVFLAVLSPGMMSFDAPTTAATGRWFARKRGLAMAVSYMGFAFGGSALTPLLAFGVDRFGWRNATLISAIGIWAVALPLATRLYRSPESRGLLPDGVSEAVEEGPAGSRPPAPGAQQDFGLRDAMSTPAYWMLCLSCGLRAMVFMAMSLHLVAIMAWKGLDETTAGLLIGSFAFVWLAATPVMGWAGDRWSKTRVAATPAFLGTVAMVLLLLLDGVEAWQMALVLGLWATNEGSWPLNFAILADRFGVRHYGALRGGMLMVVNLMSFGAPFYSGWIFDRTGSYQWVVLPAAVLLGVAALLNWSIPEARRAVSGPVDTTRAGP